MSKPAVDTASAAVAERLLEAPELAAGGSGGAVSVYLSMPGELGTEAVVRELFKRGKKIYIPKVGHMISYEYSYERIAKIDHTEVFLHDCNT